MSAIEGKELKYAVTHNPLFVPGVGQFGPTLSSESTGASRGVKMTVSEPWVIIEVTDKGGNVVTMPVPITGFTHTVVK